jgi:hypothetical protein
LALCGAILDVKTLCFYREQLARTEAVERLFAV